MGPAPVTRTVARLPERARAHRADHLPGLGNDGRRLQQDAEEAEGWIELGEEARLDPPALGHEPVDLLDAPFRVLAVAAHVPLADRAVRTRHRIRTADDPHDQVAGLYAAVPPGIEDSTQRFMTQDQALAARRRPAVRAGGDLDVRPADAHRHRLDHDRPGVLVRLGDLLEANRVFDQWLDRDCFHGSSSMSRRSCYPARELLSLSMAATPGMRVACGRSPRKRAHDGHSSRSSMGRHVIGQAVADVGPMSRRRRRSAAFAAGQQWLLLHDGSGDDRAPESTTVIEMDGARGADFRARAAADAHSSRPA